VIGASALATMAFVLAPASRADDQPLIEAQANGNIVTGGLSFTPAKIDGHVGQLVRWTNTDVIAPHTVTEVHGLFNLVGNNVNGTPISAPGFDTSVTLPLNAGTINYYCVVHPTQMRGVLNVPVTLQLGPGLAVPTTKAKTERGRRRRAARRRAFQRTLTITWGYELPSGQVFDVERRIADGAWTSLATSTTKTSTRIKAGKRGTKTTVRARLRRADDVNRATGWSPEASVTG
jgi:plastocyanin